jgi:septal ring factor EnvC (AmiA/AmiB activator)
MNKNAYAGFVAMAIACTATADQITVPNSFAAGTPARAAQVNANFAALVTESNAQDTRLTSLQTSATQLTQSVQTLEGTTATHGTRLSAVESSVQQVNQGVQEATAENGAQNQRLQYVEAAISQAGLKPVTDQLICPISYLSVTDNSSFSCIQSSVTSGLVTKTFRQILSEGWIVASGGGGEAPARIVMIFNK